MAHALPMPISQRRVEALLAAADIRVGGAREWDIDVHDRGFFRRVLRQGSLGLGETYMDGVWDTRALDETLRRMIEARLEKRVPGWLRRFDSLRASLLNLQSRRRSRRVGERHYDLGNDLYRAMLGPRMIYSCGYWRAPGSEPAAELDEAQVAKLDLVCRKLMLQPGERVLDIGCGWGGALKYAAERYGVRGVGVTISREQAEHARRECAGLPIEIRLQDYRDLDEPFDKVWSLGMLEHVGVRNYARYFATVQRCLRGQGLFLLHSIGNDVSVRVTDPWIARYIFPNSMLPSPAQLTRALEGRFVIEDWHNFGADYDLTLQAWQRNVEAAWDRLDPRYDERFRRMWRFYLSASIALFRGRRAQLWQMVLSPHGVRGGYVAPR
jgi:cyclopropane-fatty-acyl-phospholipid synthase